MAKESPTPDGLPAFDKLPWDDLYPRLLLAALFKIGRMVWRGEFRGHVPGGRTARDAVHTAVEKFLANERQWNWDKSAYENLWGAVSGVIINWGTSAENGLTSRIDDDKVIQLPIDRPSSEDEVEWKSERGQLLQYLHAKDRSGEAARMAVLMLDYELNGPELEKVMKRSRQYIDNLKEKLRRWTKEHLANSDPGDRSAAR